MEHERQVERIEPPQTSTNDATASRSATISSSHDAACERDRRLRRWGRERGARGAQFVTQHDGQPPRRAGEGLNHDREAAGMARAASLGLLPRAPVPVLSGRLLLGGGAKDDRRGYAKLLCRDRHRGDRVEDEVEACLRGLDEAGLIDGVGSVLMCTLSTSRMPMCYRTLNYQEPPGLARLSARARRVEHGALRQLGVFRHGGRPGSILQSSRLAPATEPICCGAPSPPAYRSEPWVLAASTRCWAVASPSSIGYSTTRQSM